MSHGMPVCRATFCREKINRPGVGLAGVKDYVILVSLAWPEPLSFFKDHKPTKEELQVLTDFSCLKVWHVEPCH